MPIGSIVNATTVIVGSTIGMLVRQSLPERIRSIIFQAVGLATLVLAMSMALQPEADFLLLIFSLIFGGLSVVSFLSYFISRPLQALEQNLKFITWLGIIYNTYWTRLVYAMDQDTVQQDLKANTDDAIAELTKLIDKHVSG